MNLKKDLSCINKTQQVTQQQDTNLDHRKMWQGKKEKNQRWNLLEISTTIDLKGKKGEKSYNNDLARIFYSIPLNVYFNKFATKAMESGSSKHYFTFHLDNSSYP